MPKISTENVASAVRKLESMSPAKQAALADEIFERQPNLMDTCLVQHEMGVANGGLEHTTNMLLICFQAMKESGLKWPVISADEQQRQLTRMVDAIQLSKRQAKRDLADGVTQHFFMSHPEQPLLAYILEMCNSWLQQIAVRGTTAETDQHVVMTCLNFVNCIAYTETKARSD